MTDKATLDEERFWAMVQITDGCWEWLGSRTEAGYGRFYVEGVEWLAHRFSLHLGGVDVTGLKGCHRCDNPPCVRLDHLFAGTAKDNVQDMLDKGRSRSRLSNEQIRRLQLGLELGTVAEIATRLGVSTAVVSRVQTGDSFAAQKRRVIDEEFEGL